MKKYDNTKYQQNISGVINMTKKFRPRILYVILIVILFYPQIFAQQTSVAVRGVWMWGSTLSSQGSSTVVNTLKENLVNKVYLLVKGTGGTKTDATILTQFLTDAHAAGIKVQFWYIVGEDNVYVTSHPDAVIYHAPKPGVSNDPYPMTGDGRVNFLYPGYKDYVLNNIKYFLTNFNLDGIHLDVIRYSHLVYSFDKNQLARADSLGVNTKRLLKLFVDNYSSMSGDGYISMYASRDTDIVKWVTMRKNIVHDYISAIKNLIQQYKPGIQLTAAFMPEGAYDLNLSDSHYSQSYSLNSPLLDEICPMSYFNSYGQSTSWLKTVTQGAKAKVSSNCKIIAGYQTFDNVTPAQVQQQIQYALEGGADGVVNFRYGTTTADEWSVIKTCHSNMMTDVKELDKTIPTDFELNQNYPNPFNPTTVIDFKLAKSGMVSLKVFDMLGREVATLINEKIDAGTYKVDFNGTGLSSGVYLYRLNAGSYTSTKKMVLMK